MDTTDTGEAVQDEATDSGPLERLTRGLFIG